jgi:hypothetical protein
MKKLAINKWDKLGGHVPVHTNVVDFDLVVVRFEKFVSVLYGK